jgi:DNA-binding response OmpR family regulator
MVQLRQRPEPETCGAAYMRVLVIEDQPQIAAAIESGLRNQEMDVAVASTASGGEAKASTEEYDVILLDVLLPDGNGIELCRRLRDRGVGSRILMLTGLSSTEDKVSGLESGADDYLSKPFEFAELLARIRALVRRDDVWGSRVLRFEDLELDLYTRVAHRAGRRILLSNKESALLECLMRNPGRDMPRGQINADAWGKPPESTSNLVDVYISSLRKKIDASASSELIHTVKGVGYRLGDS